MWERLLGCFGDSLLRKFGPEAPDEWVAGISMLHSEQVARAFRRMMSMGLQSPPTLPLFMRCARAIGEEEDAPRPPQAALSGPDMDVWEMSANRRLLQHITTQIPENPQRYGPRDTPIFAANVQRLVEAKRAYAADMRDMASGLAAGQQIDAKVATAIWLDYIGLAEKGMTRPAATGAPA